PLLEDTTIQGARGILINITGNQEMTLHEVSTASRIVQEAAHPEAHIIFGSVFDEAMKYKLQITVIATGFEEEEEAPVEEEQTTEEEIVRPQLRSALEEEENSHVQIPEPVFEAHEKQDKRGALSLEVPAFLRRRLKT
ncbi:MAG: cell division protein FtsZ, partial [Acidobacteriota bacterium]